MIRSLRRGWQTDRLRVLVKPALVLVVLALAALLGQRATSRLLLLAVLGLGSALAALRLTRRPTWGLFALIAVSFLVPVQLGTGTRVPLNATLMLVPALLGLWLVRMVVIERAVRLAPSPANRPLLLFALAGLVSLLWGLLIWPADVPRPDNILLVSLGQWVLYAFSVGALLLAGNLIRQRRALQTLVGLFLGLAALMVAGSYVPGLRTVPTRLWAQAAQGSMFWVWLVALAYAQLLFNRRLAGKWKALLAALLALVVYDRWAVAGAWFSGWAPPLVAIVTITWLRSWKAGLLLTLALLLVVGGLYPQLVGRLWTDQEALGALGRQQAYTVVWEVSRSNPVLGIGLATYWHYIRARYLWPGFGLAQAQINSHNNYIDIFAQMGVVGLGLFLWAISAIARSGWRLRSRAEDGFTRGYVNGALGGLAGTLAAGMFGDWLLPFVYNIGFPGFRASVFAWIFLGGFVAVEHMGNRRPSAAESN